MTRKVKSRTLRQLFARLLSVFVSFSMVLSLIPTQGAAEISDQLATGSPSTEELVAEPANEAKKESGGESQRGPKAQSLPSVPMYEDGPSQGIKEETDQEKGNSGSGSKTDAMTEDVVPKLTLGAQGEVSDLSSLMVYAKVSDGVSEDVDKVYNGQNYAVAIKFAEVEGSTDKQFATSTTMSYQLPTGFNVSAKTGVIEIPIQNSDYAARLGFSIDGNNLVTFTWQDTQSPGFQHFADSINNAWFELKLNGTFDQNSNDLTFPGAGSKTVEFESPDNYAVSTQSKSGSYDKSTNTMQYTVKVRSQGYNTNVNVTDQLTNTTYLKLEQNSLSVQVGGENVAYTVNSQSDDGYTLTIPALSNGQEATITYRASVDLDKLIQDGYFNNMSIGGEQAGTEITRANIRNDVATKSDQDTTPDAKQWPGEWEQVSIPYSSISKSASQPSDAVDGKRTVTWTVTVNPEALVSMAGETITDAIGDSSKGITKYSTDVTLTVKDASGANVGSPRTIAIANKDTASSWSYEVPASDTGAYSYVFTYNTEVDVSDLLQATNVSNTVGYDGTKAKGTTTSGVTVNPGESVITANKAATKVDINAGKITWRIDVNVPDRELSPVTITDAYPSMYYSNDEIYYDSLFGTTDDIVVTGLEDNESYSVTPAEKGITLDFYKDANKTDPGLGAYGARTISVELSTAINKDWMDKTKDVNDYHRNHKNEATVNVAQVELKPSAEVTVDPTPTSIRKTLEGIDKSAQDQNGNYVTTYKYKVVLAGINESSFDEDGKIVLEDTFDSRYLTYHKVNGSEGMWGSNESAGLYTIDNYTGCLSVTSPSDGKLVFTIDNSAGGMLKDGKYNPSYLIYYYLRVKDSDTEEELKNEARKVDGVAVSLPNTVNWGNKDLSSTASAEYKVPVSQKTIDSQGFDSRTGTYKVTFTLTINEAKAMLGSDRYITATDTYENLSVDYQTIKVVECDPESSRDDIAWDGKGNTITYRVPNGTKAKIRYTALVGKQGQYSNDLVVKGQSAKKEGSASWDASQSSSGGGSEYQMRILKQEEGALNKTLGGVSFDVYRLETDAASTQTTDSSKDFTKDNETWHYWKTVTTSTANDDSNGYAVIDNTSGAWLDRVHEFMVREVPTGTIGGQQYVDVGGTHYKYDDTLYKFRIGDENDYSQGVWIYKNDDVLKVKNQPLGDQTLDVSVNKVWDDGNNKDGLRPDSVTVNLIQDDGLNEKVLGTKTLSAQNEWKESWTGLPYGFTYSVREDAVNGYTTTYTNNAIKKAAANEGDNNITVTNTLKTVTDVAVSKSWVTAGGQQTTAPDDVRSVTVTLRRQNKVPNATITSTTDSSQSVTVPGLKVGATIVATYNGDFNDTSGGSVGFYYGNANGVYQSWNNGYSSWLSVKKGVQLTFTVPEGYKTSGIIKFQPREGTSFSDYNFTVQNGASADFGADNTFDAPSITLSAANDWSGTFAKLPLSGDMGAYRYYAEETAVTHKDGTAGNLSDYAVQYKFNDQSIDAANAGLVATPVAGHLEVINKSTATTPNPIEVPFSGTKTLATATGESKPLSANQFGFTVTADASNPANGANETNLKKTGATNAANGAIDFGKVTFSKAGTWKYTVAENTIPDTSGILADSKTYPLTIAVAEQEGQLVATVTGDGDAATTTAADKLDFANTQLSGTAALKVSKTVTGDTNVSTYNASANESFEFRLAKYDTTTGDMLPNPATATATAGNTATFGGIAYTTPGTYYYTIAEHEPGTNKTAGMAYNATPVYAKVVVTKNAESKKLDTVVTYSTTKDGTYGSNPLAITNTYTAPAADAVSNTLTATKKVNNAAPGTRTFSFSATAANNNPSEGLDATQFNATATNDAQGAVSFGTLTFSKPGTWVYEVKETSTSTGNDGLTMDAAVYIVTFSVTKDVASNTLHVSKAISKKVGQTTSTPGAIEFNNTYAPASVSVAFNGTKTLARGTLAANQFSFELQGTSANAASTHLTASNDASGNISFGSVEYTSPGIYEYDVKETSTTAANPGFECDTTVHKLVVTVTDNNAGKLVASATVDGTNKGSNLTSVGGLDFANTVLGGTVTLGVSKTVRGNTDRTDYNANEQFTFHLAKADGSSHNSDELPATAQAEVTAKAGVTSNFGAITFKEPGTYYYSISEVEPNSKTVGMTYAATQYVRVNVERNTVATESTLKVTSITYGPSLAMLKNNTQATATATGVVPMVNTYAKTTYTPQITKAYRSDDGTSAPPAETFNFALADKTDADTKPGESIPDDGTSASAVFTGADTKTASFGTITYTKPGTYVYEISEQTPASPTHGTSYSTGKVNVSVAVVADANGKLTATPTITGGDNNDHQLENVHNHNADGTTVALAGTKTLNNGVPGSCHFSFSVTRKSGNNDDVNETGLKATAQNTDVGAIDFGSVVFTKPGTWVYEVKETSASSGSDGLTVDPTVYTVTYVVNYDASNNDALKATRTITKPKATGTGTDTVDAIAFNNVYNVKPASVTLGGTKTMRGGTVSNEQFSFELLDSSNKVIQTVKNQSDGTYTFSALSFSAEGTYTYTVREKSDVAANIVRDDTTYGVSIEVTDNHNGQMMAKVTTANQKTHVSTVVNANAQATVTAGGLNFANVQLRGSAQLQVKKAFATDANHNSTYAGDDTFTFQVERVSGPQTGDVLPSNHEATAKADGTATFGNILFSQEGTYFYKITEKPGMNAGIAYNTEPRYAKVVVTRNTSSNPVAPTLLAEVKYGNEAVADKCNASSLTITNTAAAPALEKFVNKDVHADLAAFDSTFTYDIVAFVTADANKVEITDELIHGIAFAEDEPQVSVVDLGTAYNHKVGKASGTVAQTGTALAAGVATSTVEGSRLTVTIDDATALRGHWLKVTYAAKLNNNTVGTYAQYNNYDQHITSNGTVLEGVDHHDGVDNTASYRVYVRKNGEMPHDATYERSSNTVTVTPPVTSVSVSKAWKDAKGNDLAWPAGAVVSVALRQTANGQTTDTGQTLQLSADSVSGTFNNLPVYAGRTYSVAEAGVTGVPEGYTATVTGNARDGFAITNTAAPKPELKGSAVLSATKKMQSSVPWTSDEQFEFTLAAEDGTKIEAVRVKAGETATFKALAYNEAGTYYYTISEKAGSTADLTYETNERWAKVEVTENKEQGRLDAKVTYGTSKDACTDTALVITNVYAVPALEKYINKDVHQDLSAFDTPFTYDILAFVTADADRVVITDPLAKGVRFLMGRNTRVSVQNIGPENDHTAYGTVQTATGTDVEEFTATVDEEAKVLTVNIPRAKAQGLRGNWVRVTYDVVLDNAVVGDTSAYQNNDVDVKTNKTVISNTYGTGHDGVATSASYEIYVQSEQGAEQKKYALEANDITVTPPTQEIRVSKVWKDAQGKEQAWPADAKVSVALLNNNKETGKTVELSANTTTGAFEGLPVYKNDNYTVAEASVSGVPQGFTVAVAGSAGDGFIITNTLKPAETPTEQQKKNDVKDDSNKNSQQPTQSIGGSGTSSSSGRASTPKTSDVTSQLAGVAFAATGAVSFAVGVRRRSRRSK